MSRTERRRPHAGGRRVAGPSRRVARLLAAVAALVVAPLALAGPAWAHASLVGSDPADDARLPTAPPVVRLEFSEPIAAPAYVVVTAPDGASAVSGDPEVAGAVVTQRLLPSALDREGSWTVAFRAVSEDGHPVTGEIGFTVGEATASAPASPSAVAPAPAAASPAATDPGVDQTAATDPGGAGSWRDAVAVTVAAALFAGAGALALLARRTRS